MEDCKHFRITHFECQDCKALTFTKCTHYRGSDKNGFCRFADCGVEAKYIKSNTHKQDIYDRVEG